MSERREHFSDSLFNSGRREIKRSEGIEKKEGEEQMEDQKERSHNQRSDLTRRRKESLSKRNLLI